MCCRLLALCALHHAPLQRDASSTLQRCHVVVHPLPGSRARITLCIDPSTTVTHADALFSPPCYPILLRPATHPCALIFLPRPPPQKVPEMVVKEIVRLGLRADRERADPSLGMGFTLEDAKALRQAASRRVALSPSPAQGKGTGKGEGGISAEEALYARVQAEVVKEDKVSTK